jgi:transcriptional regulator with XRE-family HTH domain
MAQNSALPRPDDAPDGTLPIGERIRRLRGKRLTQRELADRAELSIDVVRSYEQGRRRPTITSLQAIARALDRDIADLLAKPRTLHGDGEHSGALQIRQALTSIDDLLGDDPEVEPLTVEDGQRALTYAWGSYWGGAYDQLGEQLPLAIARARATVRAVRSAERADAADIAAQMLQVASSTLVHLGYTDVAHLALRQAIEHAVHSSDPLREQAMRSSIAWVLLVEGRWDDSARLAERVAGRVEPDRGDAPMSQWALYGSLLLSSATAQGRAGDRDTALALIGDADRVAARTGHSSAYEVHFGPHQTAMQRVDVEIVTAHYNAALKAAKLLPRDAALPLAARARHMSDVALALTEMRRDDKALDVLEATVTMAPKWARYQVQPGLIFDQLRERAVHQPRLVRLGRALGRAA